MATTGTASVPRLRRHDPLLRPCSTTLSTARSHRAVPGHRSTAHPMCHPRHRLEPVTTLLQRPITMPCHRHRRPHLRRRQHQVMGVAAAAAAAMCRHHSHLPRRHWWASSRSTWQATTRGTMPTTWSHHLRCTVRQCSHMGTALPTTRTRTRTRTETARYTRHLPTASWHRLLCRQQLAGDRRCHCRPAVLRSCAWRPSHHRHHHHRRRPRPRRLHHSRRPRPSVWEAVPR